MARNTFAADRLLARLGSCPSMPDSPAALAAAVLRRRDPVSAASWPARDLSYSGVAAWTAKPEFSLTLRWLARQSGAVGEGEWGGAGCKTMLCGS